MTVDTKKYIEFVYGVTSAPSQDSDVLQERISELVLGGADVSHLLTAALGLTAAVSYTHLTLPTIYSV